jgi:hypothetical protein
MVMVQVLYVEQRIVGAAEAAESSEGFDPELDEALEGAAAG